MQTQWISAGFDPDSFWDQTIRTLSIGFKGAEGRIERSHNQFAWLAWHIVGMAPRPRGFKMPKLEKLLYRRKPESTVQTPEQMLSIIRMMNAAFGGIDLTRDKKG